MLKFKKAHSIQARLLEKPSLLRNVCDEVNRAGNAAQFSSMMKSRFNIPSSPRRYSKRRTCSCRSSEYSLRFPFWSARLSSSVLIHDEHCDLSKYRQIENSWNLRFLYCGRLLDQAVTASIHLARGAGGFSISPKLDCNRVVSSEDSVFELIRRGLNYIFCYSFERELDAASQFDSLIREIDQEFRNGKALARDVDENGNSLLHVSHLAHCSDSYFNKFDATR